MSLRRATAALVAVCAIALLAPMSVLAAPASRPHARTAIAVKTLANIPVTGTATNNHKSFKGTFTVQRFITKNGQSYAVGTLTGTLGHRSVHRNNVAIPASIGKTTGAHDAATTGCPVLHLDLGPLNLNLLGLQVHLNRVVLDITAVPGAGNLLGNLLCNVANLLNGGGAPVSLTQVTALLNILNSVLSNPALLNL